MFHRSGLVASVMRFVGFLDNNSFVNATWNAVILLTWTEVEPAIYLISACIMMYRPLLERIFANTKLVQKNRRTRAEGTPQQSLESREGIELPLRHPRVAHRFMRLHEQGDEEAILPEAHEPGQIRITTNINVSRHL